MQVQKPHKKYEGGFINIYLKNITKKDFRKLTEGIPAHYGNLIIEDNSAYWARVIFRSADDLCSILSDVVVLTMVVCLAMAHFATKLSIMERTYGVVDRTGAVKTDGINVFRMGGVQFLIMPASSIVILILSSLIDIVRITRQPVQKLIVSKHV